MTSKLIVLSLALSLATPSLAFEPGFDLDTEIADVEVTEVRAEVLHSKAFFNNQAIGMGTCLGDQGSSKFEKTIPPKAKKPMGLSPMVKIDMVLDGLLGTIDKVDQVYDKVVNLGKKIWTLYDSGKPVVNLSTDIATALPANVGCWTDLQNWQAPEARTFKVQFYNQFGFEILSFSYRVVYLFGGSKDGKGKYIGYATIQPGNLSVGMLHDFSARASVSSVYNMGSKEDPVAGMILELDFTIKKSSGYRRVSHAFHISGAGEFKKLE